uniref:Uncharacterized protein n=1 Tax=Vombatus ursinus TaxID=29139 RepID=A0A4X2LQ42_VOMUR
RNNCEVVKTSESIKCGRLGLDFPICWGFILLLLYMGFRRGADPRMPEPTVLSLLWG